MRGSTSARLFGLTTADSALTGAAPSRTRGGVALPNRMAKLLVVGLRWTSTNFVAT
jgi:hypothetical protein